MQRKFLEKAKNGCDVYVDMEHSHAATHLSDKPELLDLAKEMVSEVAPERDYERYEKDFGRPIGTSDLVTTTDVDEIVYAKRLNRDIYTCFVKNRTPEPTSFLVVHLEKVGEKEYELATVYAGREVPPFPGDPFETKESKSFWAQHALVWGRQAIVPGTETAECPW